MHDCNSSNELLRTQQKLVTESVITQYSWETTGNMCHELCHKRKGEKLLQHWNTWRQIYDVSAVTSLRACNEDMLVGQKRLHCLKILFIDRIIICTNVLLVKHGRHNKDIAKYFCNNNFAATPLKYGKEINFSTRCEKQVDHLECYINKSPILTAIYKPNSREVNEILIANFLSIVLK